VQSDPSATAAPTASAAYRQYVVWLLFLIAIVNYFDRQIVNILAEAIKVDLGLADWQLGLLTGLAFAALYTTFGIPVALLADRWNRATIISGSLAFWSVFTAVCGFAQNFGQLLAARLAVGLGEAGCQPPSLSLITDYAPKEKRSSTLAIYSLGIPAGSLLALSLGGVMVDAFGWRTAFLVAGVPGILLAILAFVTLKDPRSRAAERPKPRPVKASLSDLRRNPVFWWLSLGSASMALISYGQLAFFGSFYLRVHAEGLGEISALLSSVGIPLGPTGIVGIGLGVIIGVAGIAGAWIGGQLGDRLSRKDASALMWLPAIVAPLCIPFYVAAFMSPSAMWSVLLLFPPKLLAGIWLGPTFAALQSVVPPDTRATASAVQSSIVLMIGLGLGPVLIGTLSDVFAGPGGLGPAEGVRWALMSTTIVCAVASFFFWQASRALKHTVLS
jgi:MFS family permease